MILITLGIIILHNFKLILEIIFTKSLLIRALKIAFVVGIILNIINQGDLIFKLDFENINFLKMGLTFIVPFCVSMYTAIAMKMKFHVGEKAIDNILLKCKSCNTCINLSKEQIIPFCGICKEKTHWKLTSIKDKECQQRT